MTNFNVFLTVRSFTTQVPIILHWFFSFWDNHVWVVAKWFHVEDLSYRARQFSIYIKQKQTIMLVFCYTITIPVTTYKGCGGGGGANREYTWKYLTILFSFNWTFQSAYPRWSHVQKEDNMSRCAGPENSSVATIGWSVVWQDPGGKRCLEDQAYPSSYRYPRCTQWNFV